LEFLEVVIVALEAVIGDSRSSIESQEIEDWQEDLSLIRNWVRSAKAAKAEQEFQLVNPGALSHFPSCPTLHRLLYPDSLCSTQPHL
jgi:hypothetical protein